MSTLFDDYNLWIVLVAGIAIILALDLALWHLSRQLIVWSLTALRGRYGQGLSRRAHPILRYLSERFPKLSRFVHARTRTDRFAGLPLTLMVVAAVYLVSLLGGVIEEVVEADDIYVLDQAIFDALAPFRDDPLLPVFLWITRFGDTETLFAVTLVATGFLWADRRPAYILPLWIAVTGSQATTWGGKYGFARSRPEFVTAETAVSPAFPSAHTTGAAAVYGFVAYAIARDTLNARQRFEIAFWGLMVIAMVGFSRIYLGVHFASDVAAGLLVGGFWLLVAFTLAEIFRQRDVPG